MKKLVKKSLINKIIAFSLAVIIISAGFPSTFAANLQTDSIITANESIESASDVKDVTLSVTPIQQEKYNYCSAACAQMMLKFFGITPESQSTLYNKFLYKNNVAYELVTNHLNSKISSKTVSYYTGLSLTTLRTKIKTSLDNGYPVIVTGVKFPHYTYSSGHYIIIYGYQIGRNSVSGIGDETQANNKADETDPDALDYSTLRFKIIEPWAPPETTWSANYSRMVLTPEQLYEAYTSYDYKPTGTLIVCS